MFFNVWIMVPLSIVIFETVELTEKQQTLSFLFGEQHKYRLFQS